MVILEVCLAHNNIFKLLSIPDEGYSLGASSKHLIFLFLSIPDGYSGGASCTQLYIKNF